jgi:enoyl-CoA hydratase/carnithine racemase
MLDSEEFNLDNFSKSFETITFEIIKGKKILHLKLNRPKQLNALNEIMFEEFIRFFTNLPLLMKNEDIRVILITGNGNSFCSGLDLKSSIASTISSSNSVTNIDIGRKAYFIYNMIKRLQQSLTVIEECPIPVIAGVHGYVFGGAMNILNCVDYKFSTKDAKFSIKEIDIGLTADLGILQRLAKQIGNESIVKRLAYTGEVFNGEKAAKYRIVDEVADDYKQMVDSMFKLAEVIAEKSPLILWGIKRSINFARDNNLRTSLDMVATLNSALIQADDIAESIKGILGKTKTIYPKL